MTSLSNRLPRALTAALTAALVIAPLGAAPARAEQSDKIVFDVVLKGIRAGELAINGKITDGAYGANGVLQTAGLVGLLRKIKFSASVSGLHDGQKFTPLKYSEVDDAPGRKSKHQIVYNNGTPVSVSQQPPRKPSVPPSTKGKPSAPTPSPVAPPRGPACTRPLTARSRGALVARRGLPGAVGLKCEAAAQVAVDLVEFEGVAAHARDRHTERAT